MQQRTLDNLIARKPAVSRQEYAAGRRNGLPSGAGRRRGVVLILVVAVLGILFVAGAALLNTVTFSAKTLDAQKIDRDNRSAVRSIEYVAYNLMREGFLGANGRPYSAAGTNVITPTSDTQRPWRVNLPTYGELPGVHTWLDMTEPENPDSTSSARVYADLEFALNQWPGIDPESASDPNKSLDPDFMQQPIPLHDLTTTRSGAKRKPWHVMDADGDGIPDSYATPITDEMMSPDLRRSLADRLRDPVVIDELADITGVTGNEGFDPDRLWLSLRIVPHGAMVNVNTRLPACDAAIWVDTLVGSALGYSPLDFLTWSLGHTGGYTYMPESDEWALRFRGGALVPRTLTGTTLMYDFADRLLPQHTMLGSPTTQQLLDSTNRIWWPYNPANLSASTPGDWQQLHDPDSAVYDRVHLLTTFSHDDQLIRSSADVNGIDRVDAMRAAGTYEWPNYPYFVSDPTDPRWGRLKFSFPYFSKGSGVGGAFAGNGQLNSLTVPEKNQLVTLLQDAFFLMLSNHAGVLNAGGQPIFATNLDLSITASSLAANVIDYADADDVPTKVTVRDWATGAPTASTVYGLERQPYITELYIKLTSAGAGSGPQSQPTETVFAVELFNPYDVPISLDGYRLKDANTSASLPELSGGPPAFLDEDLAGVVSGNQIPPRSFQVFYSDDLGTPVQTTLPGGRPAVALDSDSPWGFAHDSRVQLIRTIGADAVVVDEFRPDIDVVGGAQAVEVIGAAGAARHYTWERDTSWVDSTMSTQPPLQRRSNWRFVVPRAGQRLAIDGHTLGKQSQFTDAAVRPVHVGFPNNLKDFLRDAFPTTGSMLLLMRHAQTWDNSVGTPEWTSFNRVGNLMAAEFDQIDNGRMPVFDVAGKYRADASTSPVGMHQGVEALPWGQLVFDYFTALPLSTEDPCDPLVQLRRVTAPPVDQDGLRVSGRININAAPWSVIAGLPLVPRGDAANSAQQFGLYAYPDEMKEKIVSSLSGDVLARRYFDDTPMVVPQPDQGVDIGRELAQAIVGYREAREIPAYARDYTAGFPPGNQTDFGVLRGPTAAGASPAYRRGYGFLTVGELLNVRPSFPLFSSTGSAYDSFTIDRRAVQHPGAGDYVRAVGVMVALGDWVTTKSHVFTVYGTIRGQFYDAGDSSTAAQVDARTASLNEVDRRAIRFQTTVDRLPMLFGEDKPSRIGSMTIGSYADVAGE